MVLPWFRNVLLAAQALIIGAQANVFIVKLCGIPHNFSKRLRERDRQ
jgi:hypothetical protein